LSVNNPGCCSKIVATNRCEGTAGSHKAKPGGADLCKDEKRERTPRKATCKELSITFY